MDAFAEVMATRTMFMRDDEGRPLGEHKAEEVRPTGTPFDLRVCPYPGSRHHHELPMNLSALKQALAHWPGILGTVAHLHRLHRRSAGSAPLTVGDSWRIGNMCGAIADFVFMRNWQTYGDGQIPAVLGSLYKITLGVTSTSLTAWIDRLATFSTPVSARMLFDYAEANQQLIGAHQVCAGPETLILELLDVVINGADDKQPGPEVLDAIGDHDKFLHFCKATAALRLLRFIVERIDAILRTQLGAELGGALSERGRALFSVDPSSWLIRFTTLDEQERARLLEDLFAQLTDARFAPSPACIEGGRALREAFRRASEEDSLPIEELVGMSDAARVLSTTERRTATRSLARYVQIERISAAIVKMLKAELADVLGIDLESPLARERGLVEFVPTRMSRPSMRAAYREVFAIDISAPAGEVTLGCRDRRFTLPTQSLQF